MLWSEGDVCEKHLGYIGYICADCVSFPCFYEILDLYLLKLTIECA